MAKSFFNAVDNLSLQDIESEADLIPLMSTEDEEALENEALPESVPILPLRNTVLFPGVVIPITAGRDKSIQLIKEANKADKIIGVVAQRNENEENPGAKDIYQLGTVAQILRVLKMPDGNTTIIIQGKKRFEIDAVLEEEPYLKAQIKAVDDQVPTRNDKEFNATIDSIKDLALQIIQENPNIPTEASFAIKNIQTPSFLINFLPLT
jgi:ATP-dependent Lon protease